MKMIANLALTILVEFFAASTFAAGASGAVKITNISVEGGQGVFINVDPRWALADCGAVNTSSGNTAFIPFSDPMFQAKYSAALTAFVANKNIGMWLSGCFTTNWGFNAHQMHSIGIAY